MTFYGEYMYLCCLFFAMLLSLMPKCCQVVATEPRAFVIPHFLSETEARWAHAMLYLP